MPVFLAWPAALQAVGAGLLSWMLTNFGAISVFFFRREHRSLLNVMLASAAGVMLASSFWSLLQPALSLNAQLGQSLFINCVLGFFTGGCFLLLGEMLFERLSHSTSTNDRCRRQRLLFASITMHNIPEGLAIGVAFGAAINQNDLLAAWMLALGIGLQNIPEGAAVSLPLHRDGFSRTKAACFGIASGAVEPLAGILGVLLASSVNAILPFCLCFAAGAMIFVIVGELVPESQSAQHPQCMTLATMAGFMVMMLLDVLLA